ncbi:DedA family protein [Leptospira wolffii]|uniref:DedA family protein n=1 Tax=Leptospira wolffii TaxID=409998 RepID=A0A2M9ZDI2_9LEPT|nr:DedA family protein [Leptospira wolffii]PJZ66469.1 DedA family protein [Leptospira wolffii]TGK59963.1 DedA family protein [Leptospira wolffii]TGK70047.1 DedA family protein [Leptospira wolffii]TGK75971.1 DedA family protein [Leptospira wolffii]TGL30222.1 DedA family protein [Leptospira wolffii]
MDLVNISALVDFFSQFGHEFAYIAVFLTLILCGFGLPVPEDISLVSGGVISGLGYANEHIMFAVGMAGVIIGDGSVFLLGRVFGEKVLRIPFVAKFLTPERFAQVQDKFSKYGNWVVFMARFMPGLRMPIYLTAGTSDRISFFRFLCLDSFAAVISVPIWVYLGHYGAKNLDQLKTWVHQGQVTVFSLLGLGIVILLTAVYLKKKRSEKA